MTVSAWPIEVCPECREASSVELDASSRLCLACRHEWNPIDLASTPYERPVETLESPVPYLAVVADHADIAETPAHIAQARSRYLGMLVALPDLGVSGVITEVAADGWVNVELDATYDVLVTPDEFTILDAAVIADDVVTALATTDMAVAAQILRAGAATIRGAGNQRELTLPPDGWLPDEAGLMPVIEHGAGYAVALVAISAGVSTDDLLSLAQGLDDAAEAAKGANHP